MLLALEKDNRWKGTITGKRKWTIAPRLLINVDHRIVGIIAFVLVNPLSATPLFSPSSLARDAFLCWYRITEVAVSILFNSHYVHAHAVNR